MPLIMCTHDDRSQMLSHGIIMCTEDEVECLMHYRTPNSKNGVRLYQNKDGSLTPLGYIHYGIGKGNRNSHKAEKYAKKAQKAQEKYERESVKSARAQDRAERKQDQRSADKAANAFKKQNDAKMQMDEYRNKAEIFNNRVKQQEDERKRKLDNDTKGLDSDSANRLREAVSSKLNGNTNADETFKEIDERNTKIDEHQFRRNIERFDKLSSHDQRKVGDEALKRVYDFDNNSQSDENKDEANELRSWMFKRIYKNSGDWNSGESVSENNKNAMEKMNQAYDKENERIDQIKKDIDYVDKDRNEKEHPFMSLFTSDDFYNKEQVKLKNALRTDKVYQALKEASISAEKDLCGAVLKDIGFSDTPENRSMIFRYVFND